MRVGDGDARRREVGGQHRGDRGVLSLGVGVAVPDGGVGVGQADGL